MKILYVTTISNTVNAFLIPHIKMLIEQGHHVDLAFNIVQEVAPALIDLGCTVHELEFERSPFSKQNYLAYKKLKQLIQVEQYDVVHTHTPVASACVRLACKNFDDVKVIYTAHGFHFFKGAPIINWLLYYPVERSLAKFTDVLVTINKEDYSRAQKFKAKKVMYIPGVGIDFNKFNSGSVNRNKKRIELGIPEDSFLLLSVGELNDNKNHETIIRAVAKLNNPNISYAICGQGPLASYLKNLSRELGIEKQVKLLGYRKDIAEICKVADIFAFPSKREGLGLAAIEAMSTGLPIVTSNIHGIVDYSIDGITGFLCKSTDVNGFTKAIEKLVNNASLKEEISERNKEKVKKFDLETSLSTMMKIYREMMIND